MRDLDDWKEYVQEAYEEYMEQNCTCDRSDDCQCMNFQQFEDHILACREEEWALAYEDCEF